MSHTPIDYAHYVIMRRKTETCMTLAKAVTIVITTITLSMAMVPATTHALGTLTSTEDQL